jgi:ABC-type proline/glycine betaine transport system permease subunit
MKFLKEYPEFKRAAVALMLVAAAIGCIVGAEGWGWFLFVGIIVNWQDED